MRTNKYGVRGLKGVQLKRGFVYFWTRALLQKAGIFQHKTLGTDLTITVISLAWMIYGFRHFRDTSREIKARRSAELEARDLARHDPLTGLPNRRFFGEKLDEWANRGRRQGTRCPRLAILAKHLAGRGRA